MSDNRMYIVRKGKKYLVGRNYSTLKGNSYRWTFIKHLALKMDFDLAYHTANFTKGKIEEVD